MVIETRFGRQGGCTSSLLDRLDQVVIFYVYQEGWANSRVRDTFKFHSVLLIRGCHSQSLFSLEAIAEQMTWCQPCLLSMGTYCVLDGASLRNQICTELSEK